MGSKVRTRSCHQGVMGVRSASLPDPATQGLGPVSRGVVIPGVRFGDNIHYAGHNGHGRIKAPGYSPGLACA